MNSSLGSHNLVELLVKASSQYFSDMLHHPQRGNQYYTAFHVEQQRHMFMEQEMIRLTVPKAEHARETEALNHMIALRDATIAQLNKDAGCARRRIEILKEYDFQLAREHRRVESIDCAKR